MASTKKNRVKSKTPKKTPKQPDNQMSVQRKIWLGFGIFLLLAGVYICFSILSYCFTWQEDQDLVLNHSFYSKVVSSIPVSNQAGRLGAYISHMLVYEMLGIASIAIGIWLGIIGASILYGKKAVPVTRYFRWLALLLLVVAPILTYLMPDAAFSYGGAWGNEAINYMNGFFGYAGTGLILFAVVCFFLFVVFALDISPIFRRARKTAQSMAAVASDVATMA